MKIITTLEVAESDLVPMSWDEADNAATIQKPLLPLVLRSMRKNMSDQKSAKDFASDITERNYNLRMKYSLEEAEALILTDRKATVEKCKEAISRIAGLDYSYNNICDALDAVLEGTNMADVNKMQKYKPKPEDYNAELKVNGTWHWERPEDQDEYNIAIEEYNNSMVSK